MCQAKKLEAKAEAFINKTKTSVMYVCTGMERARHRTLRWPLGGVDVQGDRAAQLQAAARDRGANKNSKHVSYTLVAEYLNKYRRRDAAGESKALVETFLLVLDEAVQGVRVFWSDLEVVRASWGVLVGTRGREGEVAG